MAYHLMSCAEHDERSQISSLTAPWICSSGSNMSRLSIVMDVTDGSPDPEFTPPSFVERPSNQAALKTCSSASLHGPFQAQQQAVIEVGGIVEPIFIQDQRIGQCADL